MWVVARVESWHPIHPTKASPSKIVRVRRTPKTVRDDFGGRRRCACTSPWLPVWPSAWLPSCSRYRVRSVATRSAGPTCSSGQYSPCSPSTCGGTSSTDRTDLVASDALGPPLLSPIPVAQPRVRQMPVMVQIYSPGRLTWPAWRPKRPASQTGPAPTDPWSSGPRGSVT